MDASPIFYKRCRVDDTTEISTTVRGANNLLGTPTGRLSKQKRIQRPGNTLVKQYSTIFISQIYTVVCT